MGKNFCGQIKVYQFRIDLVSSLLLLQHLLRKFSLDTVTKYLCHGKVFYVLTICLFEEALLGLALVAWSITHIWRPCQGAVPSGWSRGWMDKLLKFVGHEKREKVCLEM